MTNNSGDMTNNISDERLRELIKTNDKESQFGRNGYYADIGNALAELLSARETIRRLVKYTDHHSGCLSEASNRDGDCTCGYAALLAELEGKGFDAAMKRVLDENKGAWKALGGEEGKG